MNAGATEPPDTRPTPGCPPWCSADDDMREGLTVHSARSLRGWAGDSHRRPIEQVPFTVAVTQASHDGVLDGPVEIALLGFGENHINLSTTVGGAKSIAQALLVAVETAALLEPSDQGGERAGTAQVQPAGLPAESPWWYECGHRCDRGACEHELHVANNALTLRAKGLDGVDVIARAQLYYGPHPPDLQPAVRLTLHDRAFTSQDRHAVLTLDELRHLSQILDDAVIGLDDWARATDRDEDR